MNRMSVNGVLEIKPRKVRPSISCTGGANVAPATSRLVRSPRSCRSAKVAPNAVTAWPKAMSNPLSVKVVTLAFGVPLMFWTANWYGGHRADDHGGGAKGGQFHLQLSERRRRARGG